MVGLVRTKLFVMKIMLLLLLVGIASLTYFCVLGYRRILVWQLRKRLHKIVLEVPDYTMIPWGNHKDFISIFSRVIILLQEFKSYDLINLFTECVLVAEDTIAFYASDNAGSGISVPNVIWVQDGRLRDSDGLNLFGIDKLFSNMGYSSYDRNAISDLDISSIAYIYFRPMEILSVDFLDRYYLRTCRVLHTDENTMSIRDRVSIFLKEYKFLLSLQETHGDEIPFNATKKHVIKAFSEFVSWISSTADTKEEVEDLQFVLDEIEGVESLEYLPSVLLLEKEVETMLLEEIEKKD